MIIIDCEQMSEQWFAEKAGKPGASSFDKIITTKGEPSKMAKRYLYQLAGESITGLKTESYQNAAMLRGIELEPQARSLFEMIHDVEVKQVGLCYPDEQKKYLCSPDGLLDNAGLEIKCPEIHTHVSYLIEGKLPTDYFQQVQGGMAVTGLPFWYFMSYYPGLPPFIIKVERDDAFISKLKAELDKFCYELAATVRKLKEMA
jgi:hypothetical protein